MGVVYTEKKSTEKEMTSLSHESQMPVSHRTYHEMSDRPVIERDEISQLASNIELLTDMQSRFSFLMRELRYVLKV